MNYSVIFTRFALWFSATVSVFISAILTKEYQSQYYLNHDYTDLDKFVLWTGISSALITLSVGLFVWTMKAIKDAQQLPTALAERLGLLGFLKINKQAEQDAYSLRSSADYNTASPTTAGYTLHARLWYRIELPILQNGPLWIRTPISLMSKP